MTSAPDAPEPTPAPDATTPAPSMWPFLLSIAAVAGLAELASAVVTVSAIPVFLKNALHLDDFVGFSLTAFYLSEAVFNSPIGSLADRIGRRRLMVLGAAASVCTSFAMAFLRAPHHTSELAKWPLLITIILLRIIDGIGAAALWPAVFAAIGDRVDQKRQSEAMSFLNTTYMIGLAFGPKVGGFLNDTLMQHVSLQNPLRYTPSFFAASICFAMAGAVAFLVAPKRSEEHHHSPEEGAALSSHEGSFSLAAVRSSLKRFPVLMGLAFLTFLGIGLIAPNVKLFAMDRFKVSEDSFGNLLLIPALFVAAISVPLGRLGDHWGKTRSIHLGMAICALSLWCILAIPTQHVVVIIGSLLGIGFVLAFPAYMAFLSDLTGPRERGGVIGSIRMAQGVGAMIGAACGSPLYARVSKEAPFLVAAGLLTLTFILGLFLIHEPGDKNKTVTP